MSIGVKPLSLSSFTMHGTAYAFAATDRPAVVYARSGKLVYSPVDERDVSMLSSFSTAAFPGALALAKESCLMIAQIDAIQKLHIRCAALRLPSWCSCSPACTGKPCHVRIMHASCMHQAAAEYFCICWCLLQALQLF